MAATATVVSDRQVRVSIARPSALPLNFKSSAFVLAELSRVDGADLARQLADQFELLLPDFGVVRIDEFELEELRRVFSIDVPSDDKSMTQGRRERSNAAP